MVGLEAVAVTRRLLRRLCLRERREDIPVLVEHFIAKHAQRAGKRIDGVAPGVLEALQAAEWAGNVRELENTVERAVVLSPTAIIQPEAVRMIGVASATPAGLPSLNLRQNLEWVEREEKAGVGEAPYPPNFPKMPDEPKRVQPSRAKKS